MSEQYVTLAEVKELLEKENENEKRQELNPVQKSAMLHAQTVARNMSKEQADELVAKLSELPFMTETTSYKIADLLPKYPEDVRAIFSKERITLEADDIDKVIDIVAEYL